MRFQFCSKLPRLVGDQNALVSSEHRHKLGCKTTKDINTPKLIWNPKIGCGVKFRRCMYKYMYVHVLLVTIYVVYIYIHIYIYERYIDRYRYTHCIFMHRSGGTSLDENDQADRTSPIISSRSSKSKKAEPPSKPFQWRVSFLISTLDMENLWRVAENDSNVAKLE